MSAAEGSGEAYKGERWGAELTRAAMKDRAAEGSGETVEQLALEAAEFLHRPHISEDALREGIISVIRRALASERERVKKLKGDLFVLNAKLEEITRKERDAYVNAQDLMGRVAALEAELKTERDLVKVKDAHLASLTSESDQSEADKKRYSDLLSQHNIPH